MTSTGISPPISKGGLSIQSLDSIRFLLAAWVLLSHAGLPDSGISLIDKTLGVIFCGPMSVAAFFIISGYCIHRAYGNIRLDPQSFYLTRFCRIALPLLASILIAESTKAENNSVLWSIYIEIAYYAIYPIILPAIRKFGSLSIAIASLLPATVILLSIQNDNGYFWEYGTILGGIYLYPLWLFGAWLAENQTQQKISTTQLIGVRLIVFAAQSIALIAHFHMEIKYIYSLLAVAPLIFIWIKMEISSDTLKKTINPNLGLATYSIYLTHMIGINLAENINHPSWPVQILLAAAISSAFFFLVERPAHKLAKALQKSTYFSLHKKNA